VPPFHVMEVMRAAEQRAAAGGEVLHLEVGQPATAAPAASLAAAHRALDDDVLGYTTAAGIPALRERIAAHYDDWYGVAVDPDAIVCTNGASGAFVLAFLAAFDVGDRVVVPRPGYPCYRNGLVAMGADVVDVRTGADERFQPTVAVLDAAAVEGPVAGLVVGSPANPTGTALDAERLDAVAQWCRAHDAWLVADEIYHGLVYGEPAPTALSADPEAIVVNSFSKFFSMTGWRLGWMVVPDALRGPVTRLAQNLAIAAPTLAQHAALGAFDALADPDDDELDANVARYRANRTVVLDGLRAAGIDRLAPADGAFYVWACTDHLADDSQALCAQWLEELGVATTPGIDFDPVEGHRFVRFSFAGDSDEIVEAMTRIGEWVRRRDAGGPQPNDPATSGGSSPR